MNAPRSRSRSAGSVAMLPSVDPHLSCFRGGSAGGDPGVAAHHDPGDLTTVNGTEGPRVGAERRVVAEHRHEITVDVCDPLDHELRSSGTRIAKADDVAELKGAAKTTAKQQTVTGGERWRHRGTLDLDTAQHPAGNEGGGGEGDQAKSETAPRQAR